MRIVVLLLLICFVSPHVYAADTTRVRTHDEVVIKTEPSKGFTEYSSKVEFPHKDSSYRKAYMYLEFGCAPGLKCGEWDYLNHIYIRKDSVKIELARFITPYGFYWNSSMNWHHGWYFDLTDFSYLLHDSAEIIYRHTGYEANNDRGWTVTMDFTFVHGEAARIPLGHQTLYQLSAPYGNANNPFNQKVTAQNFTMPMGSDMVNFKTIQTGHGMDQQENCAEFCAKIRYTYLDQNQINEKRVWRDDCGYNSLYPQAGTWVYDRAGWCPGASVIPDDIFQKLDEGSEHEFRIDMQTYTNNTGGSANYVLTTHAQYFKDNRKTTDAAIDEILAPSKHYENLRINPTCGAPIIRVKNLGMETITRLDFRYGKMGGDTQQIWVPCNIPPFETGIVELEAVHDWSGPGNTFFATIISVNEMEDEYMDDNTQFAEIVNTATFPNRVYIVFKSNNAPRENSYTLIDARGNEIVSRSDFEANTIYRDTVELKNNVCYKFTFSDEGQPPANVPLNEDGLNWWANTADGSGYIQLRSGKNNSMLQNFNADFGTKHEFHFYTTFDMSVEDIESNSLQMDLIPNPSSGSSRIHIETVEVQDYQIEVLDALGRKVFSKRGNQLSADYNIDGLEAGIYFVVLTQGEEQVVRKLAVQ